MNESPICSLSEAILAAFTLALRDQNMSAADHLLRALEVLAAQQGDVALLDNAYLLFLRSTPGHRQ